ncbi:hypothetical protein TL16_g10356 [Triparma laevis f. inornata]|uniref:Uncharacterized protein n=1 Tax=Triparma laevis f. inornata TaxID=1714386 RepID=A0A9W7EQ27_9STRA|nr:hypothetical protein TL16_g10356 [Triparma laevis f. inornata]
MLNVMDQISSFSPQSPQTPGPQVSTPEIATRSRADSLESVTSNISSTSQTPNRTRRNSRLSKHDLSQLIPESLKEMVEFGKMQKMVLENKTLDSRLLSHIKTLESHTVTTDATTSNLSTLESSLQNLTSSFLEMKSLREDYSDPSTLEFRTLSTPLIEDLFPIRDVLEHSRSSGGIGRRRSFDENGKRVGESDVETKATNRYPLRKRASTVRYAAKLAKQRHSKLEPLKIPVLHPTSPNRNYRDTNKFNYPSPDNKKDFSGVTTIQEKVQGEIERGGGKLRAGTFLVGSDGSYGKTSSLNFGHSNQEDNKNEKVMDLLEFKRSLKPLQMSSIVGGATKVHKVQKRHRAQSVLLNNPVLSPTRKNKAFSESFINHDGKDAQVYGIGEDDSETESEDEIDENTRFEAMIRPLSASTRQYLTTSKNYNSYSQKQNINNKPRTPRRIYMKECERLGVAGEKVITATTRGVSLDGGVSLKNKGLGDKQLQAFAEGVGAMYIRHLDLSNNRILEEKTSVAILSKLDPFIIQKLDWSKNRLTPKSFKMLTKLVGESTNLLNLGLEESNLLTPSLKILMEAICRREVCSATDVVIYECPLKVLNLAGNNIDDAGAKTIAKAIPKCKNLLSLDLSWNNIRNAGACAVFDSITSKSSVESLDVGYNAIGTATDVERDAVKCLAKMVSEDDGGCSLTHLNVSHNQMNANDCEVIGKALEKNHTLMGIHVEGNQGFIDSRGFLIPDAEGNESVHQAHATVFSRILPLSWKTTCNCWICERWQEHTFIWDPTVSLDNPDDERPTDSYSVMIALSYEKWAPQRMQYDADTYTYRLLSMVPPGKQQYAFIVDDEAVPSTAADQKRGERDATWGNYDEKSAKNLPKTVNTYVMVPTSDFDSDKSMAPRTKEKKIVKKGKWIFPKSLFAEYQQDSEDFLTRCFDFDYGNTGIQRRIAKKGLNDDEVEDEQKTQALLRENYEHIKHIFKSYAAAIGSGNEIFTMGKNAYYEFLSVCDIIDNESVKNGLGRAEVALVFVSCQTIGPKSSFNKKNALCRFQFMDAIVSLATTKFLKTRKCSMNHEALKMLLDSHIIPKSDMLVQREFRLKKMYVESVDVVLRRNLGVIEALYKKYSGKTNLPNEKNKTVSSSEWQELCDDANLVDDGFIDRHIRVIYVRSIETAIDELHDKSFRTMNFCEFLHGICWIASFLDSDNDLSAVVQRLITRLIQFCLNNSKKRESSAA